MLAEERAVGRDNRRSDLVDPLLSLHHAVAPGDSFEAVKEKREASADEDEVEFLFVVHVTYPPRS